MQAFDVWPELEPIAAAFQALSEGRQWMLSLGGAFPQPLLYQEIESYARAFGFDRPRRGLQRFVRLVKAQDRAWLAFHRKDRKDTRNTEPSTDDLDDPADGDTEDGG